MDLNEELSVLSEAIQELRVAIKSRKGNIKLRGRRKEHVNNNDVLYAGNGCSSYPTATSDGGYRKGAAKWNTFVN